MMTSSNGNIFRVNGPLCGEFSGPGEFPTQRPVTRSFDVFFDLRLNKPLSKQSWGWWFDTLSRSLWRHRNDFPWPKRCCISLAKATEKNPGSRWFSLMLRPDNFTNRPTKQSYASEIITSSVGCNAGDPSWTPHALELFAVIEVY